MGCAGYIPILYYILDVMMSQLVRVITDIGSHIIQQTNNLLRRPHDASDLAK